MSKETLRTDFNGLQGKRERAGGAGAGQFDGLHSAALDLGAQGVMTPMVNSAADANKQSSVPTIRRWAPRFRSDSCQPVPKGRRGGTGRRRTTRSPSLCRSKHRTAAENATQILDTDGIDGVFIGNGDLANFMNQANPVPPTYKKLSTA